MTHDELKLQQVRRLLLLHPFDHKQWKQKGNNKTMEHKPSLSKNAEKLLAAWGFVEAATNYSVSQSRLKSSMEIFFDMKPLEFDNAFSELVEYGFCEKSR